MTHPVIQSKRVAEFNGGRTPFGLKLYTFANAYQSPHGLAPPYRDERAVSDYLRTLLEDEPEIAAQTHEYAIAFAYGFHDKGIPVKGADIYAARFDVGPAANQMFDSWTFENGLYVPREKGTFCGNEIMILSAEEQLRRTMGLEQRDTNHQLYLTTWPDIDGLPLLE